MKNLSENQKIIQKDIMRYKTNKLAANLALLGLAFNCLYFMLFYSMNNSYFYTIEIGISVILTLVVLLLVFYSSVGVKGYVKKFSYVLWVLAGIQILRLIFGPVFAASGITWFLSGSFENVMTNHYFGIDLDTTACCILLVLYLALSAGCLIASGIVGFVRSTKLSHFNKQLENGEVSVEKAIKELDSEEMLNKGQNAPVKEVE